MGDKKKTKFSHNIDKKVEKKLPIKNTQCMVFLEVALYNKCSFRTSQLFCDVLKASYNVLYIGGLSKSSKHLKACI